MDSPVLRILGASHIKLKVRKSPRAVSVGGPMVLLCAPVEAILALGRTTCYAVEINMAVLPAAVWGCESLSQHWGVDSHEQH